MKALLKTFDDLGLAEPLLKAISAEGYTQPTPIQGKAIPILLSGQDVLGIAQTGTGKTAAFVLPLLDKISGKIAQKQHSQHEPHDRKTRRERQGRKARYEHNWRKPKMCSALILAPTRELAAQIAGNVKTYSKYTKISSTLIVGGMRPGRQINALKAGVDIVIATPGRLQDHISSGAIFLDQTQMIVIDEADQMLDLGFLPQMRNILQHAPHHRQTALFSATMPMQIKKLAEDILTNPKKVSVAAIAQPVDRISQTICHVAQADKPRVLTEILADKSVERMVVFTRTKRGADRICKHLIASNFLAAALHGNKSQGQRDLAMSQFRAGKISVLVATDIAARGIDIDDISHVVNFDLPNVPEAYVHRIGRTARAGKSGVAISLCDPSERALLRDIEKLIGASVELDSRSTANLGAQDSHLAGRAKGEPTKPLGRNGKPKKKRRRSKKSAQPKQAMSRRSKAHLRSPDADKSSNGRARRGANTGLSKKKSAA